jgi:hypothetical protein
MPVGLLLGGPPVIRSQKDRIMTANRPSRFIPRIAPSITLVALSLAPVPARCAAASLLNFYIGAA